MDLCAENAEVSYAWLQRNYEFCKDRGDNLGWRVPTNDLQRHYDKWIRSTRFPPLASIDIWGIIQICWPFVTIIGSKGNRAFTCMKKRDAE
jgi:hypothetical protein